MTIDGPPLDPEDVGEFFLAMMPFLALPNPRAHSALPGPRALRSEVVETGALRAFEARATVEVGAPSRGPEPMRVSEAPRAQAAAPQTFVRAPDGASAIPAPDGDDRSASPWDPGFDPPTTGLRTGPEPEGPDPRSLSLNRPRRQTGSVTAARVTPPTAPAPKPRAVAPEASHDLLILPQNPAFKASDQGVKAVMTYLRTAQMFMPRVRHDTEEGTVIELSPDVFVHMLFVTGQAPAGAPSVREASIRVWPQPTLVPFGPAGRKACFALELIGCRFPMVLEAFKARLHQILYLRPEIHAVPHDPARLRPTAPVEPHPIPAFDLQEVDRS